MNEITVSSMIFYSILSLIVFILMYAAEKTEQKSFLIILVATLSFVAGFRDYTVGVDTASYVSLFRSLAAGGTYDKEAGFAALCKGLMWISNNNCSILLLLFAILTYSLIFYRFWELRNKISFMWAAFSFYSFYFFESLNVMRQFCAVAIVFFGTRYLYKRKYFSFMVSVVIAAVMFHKSAILCLLFLPIELLSWRDLEKKQKRILFSLFLGVIIFRDFIISSLDTYLENYKHYLVFSTVDIGFRVFALVLLFIVSLFLFQRKEKQLTGSVKVQNDNYLLRNVRIYYIAGCILGSMGYFYEFVGRVGYYFIMFTFVYFGMIVKETYWQYRWILKAMVFFLTMYVLLNYIFVLNGAMHHPYHFIWE